MLTKTSLAVKVKCSYGEKCSDAESGMCKSCRHNELRSYYEPNYQPHYQPYYYFPYYYPSPPTTDPYYPYCGTETITYGDTNMGGTSYYSRGSGEVNAKK